MKDAKMAANFDCQRTSYHTEKQKSGTTDEITSVFRNICLHATTHTHE